MSADHLRQALDNELRQRIVDEAVQELENEVFNTIVCTGISGLLIAPAVAERLDKQLCVVRKENEDCHSFNKVEVVGNDSMNYVFLDDLVDCGKTFYYIHDQMSQFSPFSNLIGIYMYRQKVHSDILDEILVNNPTVKIFTKNSEEYEDG